MMMYKGLWKPIDNALIHQGYGALTYFSVLEVTCKSARLLCWRFWEIPSLVGSEIWGQMCRKMEGTKERVRQ